MRHDYHLFFDGSKAGVPSTLDLDGTYLNKNGKLLLSFDGSAEVNGITFDDEDVLLYDLTNDIWVLAYDGSAKHPGWAVADLNALCFIAFQVVNSALSGTPDSSTFSTDPTPVTDGPAGTFSFNAEFCNTSADVLKDLKSITEILTNGNVLINRDIGTPPGVGSALTFTNTSGLTDLKLEPGECVTIHYEIGLATPSSFQFLVNVFGFTQ